MSDDAANDEIFVTQDGSHSMTASRFGVSYHSKYGAITESQHVFIQAGLVPFLLNTPDQLSILEMGFGTGLNALLTFYEIVHRSTKIYYEAIENFPISDEASKNLNYPQLIDQNNTLLKVAFKQMHSSSWEEEVAIAPRFSLKKRLGNLESMAFSPHFDLIYFDAFAPSAQPELWTATIMQKMYDALRPGGVLVTYCAKGEFKRTLKSVGFTVECLPGPPGKREMTKAIKERA